MNTSIVLITYIIDARILNKSPLSVIHSVQSESDECLRLSSSWLGLNPEYCPCHRVTKSVEHGEEDFPVEADASVSGSYIDTHNWSVRSGTHFKAPENDTSSRRGRRRNSTDFQSIVNGSGSIRGGSMRGVSGEHHRSVEEAKYDDAGVSSGDMLTV